MQSTAKCDVTQEFCLQQQQEAKQDPEALALPLDWRSMVGEKEATAAHWPSRQHRCRVEDRWY